MQPRERRRGKETETRRGTEALWNQPMVRRAKPSPMTYADAKRHAGRVTVRLRRDWWGYLYFVALDRCLGLFPAIRQARMSDGDELDVEGEEATFTALADAAEDAGRTRTAEELRKAIAAAKTPPKRERKRKAAPETPADAMRRLFAAGELEPDEIEMAKGRGWL